ncbi:MAG TPA: ATP synthase F1 subunit delta [Longimicrobium sp.]
MRAEIIARNYAETLLALAERHGGAGGLEEFGRAADALAELLRGDPRMRQFLETPRVTPEQKKAALRQALTGRAPEMFVRFVMVLADKRRQSLLPDIAQAYRELVDERMGRVRVHVTISHAPDAALQAEIGNTLADRLGKTVIPTFTVDPDLLGGMVVRVGDQILDGSVRTRAAQLRRRMLGAELPPLGAAPAAV